MATATMNQDQSSTIVSRYKRYKAGTKQVVNWLANTAAQYCELCNVLDCLKSPRNSKRANTISVNTRELLALAKTIAAVKEVTVPAGILDILQDVIDGRRSCAGWYSSQTLEADTDLASQNESHLYFISILLSIQKDLAGMPVTPGSEINPIKTGKSSKKGKSKKAGKAATEVEDMRNLFGYLDVEEPSDMPLGQGGPFKSGSMPERLDYELESEQETDAFALWCHLKDMSDTRIFLMGLWLEYRRGDITIEISGTVTEIALSTMSRAHEEFILAYPQFDTWGSVMDFLQLHTCFTNNVVCIFPRNVSGGSNVQHFPQTKETSPTDLLCATAAHLLCAFSDAALKCRLGRPNEMFTIPYLSDLDRPDTAFDKHLLPLAPDIFLQDFMKNHSARPCYWTSFADALVPLVKCLRPTQPSMSTVFACQICIDINEIVESDPSCGRDALFDVVSTIKASIENMVGYFGNYSNVVTGHTIMIDTQIRAEAIQDWVGVLKQRLPQDASMEDMDRVSAARTSLLALHACPHIAGQLAYDVKLQAHIEATKIANHGRVVISMAHFYKAACRYGLVTSTWHDMEFVTAQHGGKKPLITKTPASSTDPYAMLKHFMMDHGADASTFAHGVQPRNLEGTRLGKAKMLDMSPSALIYGMQARHTEHQKLGLNCTPSELYEGVLSAMTAKSDSGSRVSKKQHLSPTQLMTTLKASMIEDEPRLNFAYLDFTIECMELLGKMMRSSLNVGARSSIESHNDSGGKVEWSFEYIYIMLEAVAMDVASGRSPKTSSVFARAALTMQAWLDSTNAKKFSQAAFDASSGRIPKAKRPKYGVEKTFIERDDFLKKYPGVSGGSSRETFELYDPEGSLIKFTHMVASGSLGKILPVGGGAVISHDCEEYGDVAPTRELVMGL